jgi:glutamate/tyrosine decarboxylase-like PLP-dependent enzyme
MTRAPAGPSTGTVVRDLLTTTAERAIRYLEGLDGRGVAPGDEAVARLSNFRTPFPSGPSAPEAVLQQLDEIGSPATMAMAGPRFFGFVIGGALPATVAASWLATAWDQNTGLYAITPATATLEHVALDWLLDALDLPRECGGAFVTGTTVANVSALAAARHAVLARAGWNVEADGLFGAPPVTVIASEEAHPTVSGLDGAASSRSRWIRKDGCAPAACRPSAVRRSSARRPAT